MAVEFDRDFDGYLDADFGHGISASYTPLGGSATTIKVVMDQQYYSIPTETVEIEGSQPMAHAKATDVPNAGHGDTLVVDAVTNLDGTTIKAQTTYKVINVQPDNTGIVVLVLEEQ
jgi:hypothetical protein